MIDRRRPLLPALSLSLSLALLLVGCGQGPSHPTLIDDLEVISIVNTPTEALPGDTVTITATVVDPTQAGAEVLIWTCGIYLGRCVEDALFEDNPQQWLSVHTLVGDTVQTTRRVPGDQLNEAFNFLEVDEIETGVFVLACAPETCPIIEYARLALEAGTFSNDLALDLADPGRWYGDVGFEGVSLTVRGLTVARSFPAGRNSNPIIEARFPERDDAIITIPAGGDQEFAYLVDDPDEDRLYAYAYTTVGQFEDRRERETNSVIRHYLLAPARATEGHVYIVFEDEQGGAVVWDRPVSIQ